MDSNLLQYLGKIAGLAGISIGLVLLIFRTILRQNIFPKLNNEQAFALIRLLMYLTFAIGTVGIIAWVVTTKGGSQSITGHLVDRVTKEAISDGEVTLSGRPESARSDGAGNFTLTITNAPSSGFVHLFVSKDGYEVLDRNAALGQNLEAELIPIVKGELKPIAPPNTNPADVHQSEPISLQLNVGEDVSSIAFSADGKFLVAGTYGNSIKIWDVTNMHGSETPPGAEVQSVGSGIQSVSLSSNWLAAGGFDKKIRVYKVAGTSEKPELIMQPEQDGKVYAVALSRDGHLLASGTTRGTVTLWREKQGVWDPHRLYSHAAAVNSITFSPDGLLLASGSDDRTIKVWDIANEREIDSAQKHYFARHNGKVAAVTFNSDGSELASASWDNSVRIWSVPTKEEIGSPFFSSAACYAVAFSPDGRWLAAGGGDNKVTVWDTNRWLKYVVGFHDKRVTSLAFGSDAIHWLASASVDGTIRFWPQPH
jgi:WD40 repeat protein